MGEKSTCSLIVPSFFEPSDLTEARRQFRNQIQRHGWQADVFMRRENRCPGREFG